MQAKVLASPKERIRNILKSKLVDRTGIFDLDIELFSEGGLKESEKFFLFCFDGPFQSMSSEMGLEEALTKFIQEPRHSLSSFKENQKQIIKEYKGLKDDGYKFDGVWMGEDIAYNNGLYFSIEKYRNQLLGIHSDLSDFFTSESLPLFFHCDGGVEDLIPLLVGAKIKAVHPVQEKPNPNLLKIKRDFSRHLTFVGGVCLHRLEQERKELLEYIQKLNEGGNYIFSFDGPIPDSFDKKEYDDLLNSLFPLGSERPHIAGRDSERSHERSMKDVNKI